MNHANIDSLRAKPQQDESKCSVDPIYAADKQQPAGSKPGRKNDYWIHKGPVTKVIFEG
jgi:hypothetical protein